jgi:hypothetical protein
MFIVDKTSRTLALTPRSAPSQPGRPTAPALSPAPRQPRVGSPAAERTYRNPPGVCYHYGQMEHWIANCPSRGPDDKRPSPRSKTPHQFTPYNMPAPAYIHTAVTPVTPPSPIVLPTPPPPTSYPGNRSAQSPMRQGF